MHNTEESKIKMSMAHIGVPNFARRRETIEKNGVTLYRCGKCGQYQPAPSVAGRVAPRKKRRATAYTPRRR